VWIARRRDGTLFGMRRNGRFLPKRRSIVMLSGHARRRVGTILSLLALALMGCVAVSRADESGSAGVVQWDWNSLGYTGPNVFTGGGSWTLGDDTVFVGDMNLPAGSYHVSGVVTSTNWTRVDRDVSCVLYAQADGDSAPTTLATTSGPLLGMQNHPPADGSFPVFHGTFISLFSLNAAGRVWGECSGGDTGQEPYDGIQEKSRPQYPEINVSLVATPVDALP
jgi:hypothetical protein